MKASLRRTLAVRFAATMAAGLALVSTALFLGTSHFLRQQLDQALAGAEVLVAGRVEQDAPPSVAEILSIAEPERYAREVNRYAALRSAGGHLIRAFPLIATDLPFDSSALARAAGNGVVWVTETWHARPIRSVYISVPEGGTGVQHVIQVSAHLEPLQRMERDLFLVLAAVVLLGSGASLLGAWRLGGSAVRPVFEITHQATRIEAGTLSQRIVAHADTEEYRGLVAVLNRMLERLDAAFQTQHRLTADVSHELRTPLTALRGEIEVALRSGRSPREYELVLRSALEEIDRLTTMSEDLLLITRAEAHLVGARRVPTNPNALLRQALAQLRRRIEEKGLTVGESLDAAATSVLLDPALTTRLIEHLLGNAVKYTPEGGRINITTEAAVPATRGVRFGIENSGVAIAAEDLPHVFEPFYRVDRARSRGENGGTGLGLALVAAIARLHGGTARVLNQDGSGVRFEVDLPAPVENSGEAGNGEA
jgi:two-component system OmpR family sensor kinase